MRKFKVLNAKGQILEALEHSFLDVIGQFFCHLLVTNKNNVEENHRPISLLSQSFSQSQRQDVEIGSTITKTLSQRQDAEIQKTPQNSAQSQRQDAEIQITPKIFLTLPGGRAPTVKIQFFTIFDGEEKNCIKASFKKTRKQVVFCKF